MPTKLTDLDVEGAALESFGELGNARVHGLHLEPGKMAKERDSWGAVVLVGPLREAIRATPEFRILRDLLLPHLLSGESQTT